MINKKITTLLSSIAFVATTAPGWAQDQLSTVSPAAAQSSTSGLAGDIVVTARRREENLQDVPVAITAFSSAALERSTVQSVRSEEHTSELQSLMRISYAVFCLKKKKKITNYEQVQYKKQTTNENSRQVRKQQDKI